jgi:hypothetical protein
MKRKVVFITAAAAAVAAIVALTAGAFAGTASRSDQPGDSFAAFTSCLASHGLQVPSDDPAAVKPWLADHQSDPAVQAALEACAGPDSTGAGKKAGGTERGPSVADLVACLERHSVDVPSDAQTPSALKPWLSGAMQQPAVKAALDDCTSGPPPNGQKKKK